MRERRSHYDVTNTICISDPHEVRDSVCAILEKVYPRIDVTPLHLAFDTFTHLYAGILPGYHGCDTWYHDVQHSLDCTLALARLIDGHERSVARERRLGERRARLGLICALFHDAGYIRRYDESQFHNGAEFTFYHVSRSASFLLDLLPRLGFAREAKLASQLVHFTGYEVALEKIAVKDARDRRLGFMLGTADLVAQMADRCYLEKCKTYLYHEFRACGLAGPGAPGGPEPVYKSPEDLVRRTPEFLDKLFEERLDGYFRQAYKYMAVHFNGINPYMLAIEKHREHLRRIIDTDTIGELRRRPRSINARALRALLNVKLAKLKPRSATGGRSAPRARRISKPRWMAQPAYLPT